MGKGIPKLMLKGKKQEILKLGMKVWEKMKRVWEEEEVKRTANDSWTVFACLVTEVVRGSGEVGKAAQIPKKPYPGALSLSSRLSVSCVLLRGNVSGAGHASPKISAVSIL